MALVLNQFLVAVWRAKEAESNSVKHWELIADRLKKAGFSWGFIASVDSPGRTSGDPAKELPSLKNTDPIIATIITCTDE